MRPRSLSQEREAQGFTKDQLAGAMRRLFTVDKIHKVNRGRRSKPAWTLEPKEPGRTSIEEET